jgi:hypothetical protein
MAISCVALTRSCRLRSSELQRLVVDRDLNLPTASASFLHCPEGSDMFL